MHHVKKQNKIDAAYERHASRSRDDLEAKLSALVNHDGRYYFDDTDQMDV